MIERQHQGHDAAAVDQGCGMLRIGVLIKRSSIPAMLAMPVAAATISKAPLRYRSSPPGKAWASRARRMLHAVGEEDVPCVRLRTVVDTISVTECGRKPRELRLS